MHRLQSRIRSIPDFPKPGIIFRDVTPLMADSQALRLTIHGLVQPYIGEQTIDAVVGIEARGFVFGALVAYELGLPLVPFRKPGKLPAATLREEYDLEYGSASLEAHLDSLEAGARVLLIDDLLATGGTAVAAGKLVEQLGGKVAGCAVVIELDGLGGRDALAPYPVHALLNYPA